MTRGETRIGRDATVRHIDGLAIEIAKQLHGLDMLDVAQVLDKVRTLVNVSTFFDATGPGFREQIDGYGRHYGQLVDPPKRQ